MFTMAAMEKINKWIGKKNQTINLKKKKKSDLNFKISETDNITTHNLMLISKACCPGITVCKSPGGINFVCEN